jgi:lipopolysaccharide export system permease protein
MKVYIKFIILSFLKSLILVSIIFFSLVFILNTLTEVEFFNEIKVEPYFPIYISLLNTPALLFEIFPFIFLIATQFFFINIFNSNQIQIFKYSGLKNSKILGIVTMTSFLAGIIIISLFYSLSSNLKNIYLEIKNKYTTDDKYLAVITNNGLWIKDSYHDEITNIIHASNIEGHFLTDNFITQFDKDYNVLRYVYSKKIDIKTNSWNVFNPKIYENEVSLKKDFIKIQSNFNYEKIQSLFSNLSSLSIMELFELKKNYKSINYSTTEVNLQIQKILSYPFFLSLMTILLYK